MGISTYDTESFAGYCAAHNVQPLRTNGKESATGTLLGAEVTLPISQTDFQC